MSHSISKGMVPWAIQNIFMFEGPDDDDMGKLCDPECWAEEHGPTGQLEDADNLVVGGWQLSSTCEDAPCLKGIWISGPVWVKGIHKVWLLNESQYNNVGSYEVTAIAENEESLKEFSKDFGHMFYRYSKTQPKIESNVPVVCWG